MFLKGLGEVGAGVEAVVAGEVQVRVKPFVVGQLLPLVPTETPLLAVGHVLEGNGALGGGADVVVLNEVQLPGGLAGAGAPTLGVALLYVHGAGGGVGEGVVDGDIQRQTALAVAYYLIDAPAAAPERLGVEGHPHKALVQHVELRLFELHFLFRLHNDGLCLDVDGFLVVGQVTEIVFALFADRALGLLGRFRRRRVGLGDGFLGFRLLFALL